MIADSRAGAVLRIDGEEDLAALAVLYHSPLGAYVYYGQPDVGMVRVVVTEKEKKYARRIVNAMSKIDKKKEIL
jgi:uncharacterized protein (UPF0218 family)